MPGVGGWGGWLETDNRAISVQLDLTGTATGTELGNKFYNKTTSNQMGCDHIVISLETLKCWY